MNPWSRVVSGVAYARRARDSAVCGTGRHHVIGRTPKSIGVPGSTDYFGVSERCVTRNIRDLRPESFVSPATRLFTDIPAAIGWRAVRFPAEARRQLESACQAS
jgi:hypothetical protein